MTAATTRTTTKAAKQTEAPITGRLTATAAAGDLAGALRAIIRFTRIRRPAVPVLAGVVLTANRGVLTCKAFDYETAYAQDVAAPGATGGTRGSVLVSAPSLLDRIAVFGRRDDLTLTVDGSSLILYGDGTRYRMPLMPLADYPTFPDVGDGPVIALSEADREGLLRTTVTAGTDDVLPILTSMHLTAAAGERITATTTDRYRLSRYVLAATSPVDLDALLAVGPLVKALSMMRRMPGPVDLIVSPNKAAKGEPGKPGARATLRTGAHAITTRTVDGEYPKVTKIFTDTAPPLTITVDADTLAAAVRRAAAGIPRNNPVKIEVDKRTRKVTLTAGGMDPGYEVLVEVPDAKVSGKPTTLDRTAEEIARQYGSEYGSESAAGLGLNPHFLRDALGAFGGERVEILIRDKHKPVEVRSAGVADYRHILMPVRLVG